MKVYSINARRIHETRDRCIECGKTYRWERTNCVSLPICPKCRERNLHLWENEKSTQEPLFPRRKP
jgi:predicted  nucleic acid-binding Zn-ribbon protein